jgi:alpha-L-rhamnosidase
MKIKGATGTGTLTFKSKTKPVCKEGVVEKKAADEYSLQVEKDKTYTINYTAKN